MVVQGGCHRLNQSVGHSVLRKQSVFELVSWFIAEECFSRGEGNVNSVPLACSLAFLVVFCEKLVNLTAGHEFPCGFLRAGVSEVS